MYDDIEGEFSIQNFISLLAPSSDHQPLFPSAVFYPENLSFCIPSGFSAWSGTTPSATRISSQYEMDKDSVRRPLRYGFSNTAHRERALRLSFEQQRLKNMKNKPPDWEVNYGQAVSLRRRNKVEKSRSVSSCF